MNNAGRFWILVAGYSLAAFFASCKTHSGAPPEETGNLHSVGTFSKESRLVRFPSGNSFDPTKYKLDASAEAEIVSWLRDKTTLFTNADFSAFFAQAKVDGLTDAETAGVIYYTRAGYRDFANYFAKISERTGLSAPPGGPAPDDEMLEALFRAAVSAVNKLKADSGDAYFGAQLPVDETLKSLKVGGWFQNRNFTSSSLDIDIANRFAGRGAEPPDLNKGSFMFILRNRKNGAFISRYSLYPNEKEILYSPNYPFKVQSVTRLDGKGGPPRYDVVLSD
jgi:ADP-ribosyltransferase exoenzyme